MECHEELVRSIGHWGEALGSKIDQAGKEMSAGRVEVYWDREYILQFIHCYTLVNQYEVHLLQSGDVVHP